MQKKWESWNHMKNRLLHIYCGDGKGKTTAATGLAVRAAGSGMRVLFARFLKNEFSGELKILDRIPEIEVLHLEKSYGFFKTLSEKEQEEVREMYGRLWNTILGKISTGDYDMLVIDEFMAAYNRKLCCGSSKGGSGNALFRGGNPPGISYDAERDRTVSGSRKDPERK